jgi:AcrR family transcriptional regulator
MQIRLNIRRNDGSVYMLFYRIRREISDMVSSVKNKTGRGRPRSSEADDLILSAGRQLLAEGGAKALTFEAVSQLTGVGRPTIYRRWRTKAHLINEIANGAEEQVSELVEQEGLQRQIAAFLEMLIIQYARPEMAAATVGLASAFQSTPGLREELSAPLEKRARCHLRAIIQKAKDIGLAKPDADSDALFDLAVGAIIYRTMFSSLDVSREAAKNICQILYDGISV